jgi:hypothetical protein
MTDDDWLVLDVEHAPHVKYPYVTVRVTHRVHGNDGYAIYVGGTLQAYGLKGRRRPNIDSDFCMWAVNSELMKRAQVPGYDPDQEREQ